MAVMLDGCHLATKHAIVLRGGN